MNKAHRLEAEFVRWFQEAFQMGKRLVEASTELNTDRPTFALL